MEVKGAVVDAAPPPLVGSGLYESLDVALVNDNDTTASPLDVRTATVTPSPLPQLMGTAAALASREDLMFEAGCMVRGDMATFEFDALTRVGRGAILRPPLETFIHRNTAQCTPVVRIGAFTVIGAHTVSEASEIGHFVRIDEGCVIGRGVVVPDGVWLQAHTVVVPEAKLAAYTVYGGCPATACGQLDADAFQVIQAECAQRSFEVSTQ